MKTICVLALTGLLAAPAMGQSNAVALPEQSVRAAFAGRDGALVFIDCLAGVTNRFQPGACAEQYPPCSTFKIWNTLLGLECGRLSASDEAFYPWDGETRFIPEWNKDLTLREAFRVSCVPAFQKLARNIGALRMQSWVDRIGYGDRNLSAGVDVFWLPEPGRRTLLIAPDEQAGLMRALALGQVPASAKAQAVLKEIMTVRKTAHGVLYGKTGTGHGEAGKGNIGWFVGYVESSGRKCAFACIAKGPDVMGKHARAIVEAVLEQQGLM